MEEDAEHLEKRSVEPEKRKRTSAIDRTLQVMDILTDRQEPMGACDLAKSAGAPVSTIYRTVDELIERDMVSRIEEGRTRIRPRLMRHGLLCRARMDMFAALAVERALGQKAA